MKTEVIKQKTLFDHIKAITSGTDPMYWSKLSDSDKKTFSSYMVNRFLSMNDDWVELITDLDAYTTAIQLSPELVFKLYYDLIPKSNIFLKYIKSKSENKYNKILVNLISSYYEISTKESIIYLNILFDAGNQKQIESLLSMYGYEDKEIKKIIKN